MIPSSWSASASVLSNLRRFSSIPGHIAVIAALGALASVGSAACGGSVQSTDAQTDGGKNGTTGNGTNGGSTGGSGGGTGVSDSADGGTALAASCPPSAPADLASCGGQVGLACEYGGTGNYLRCSTIAECRADGVWHVTLPQPSCKGIQADNEAACPSSFGALSAGIACPAGLQGSCAYPEGVCECATCSSPDGTGKGWSCARWLEPQGCPSPRPHIGSACSTDGQECDYANVCSAVSLELPDIKCVGGVWQPQVIPTPPCAFPSCGQ
jgi:hypothetical protein